MFSRKTRKKFNVSTNRVYLSGKKSRFTRVVHYFKPYTKRAVYRSTGTLFAL